MSKQDGLYKRRGTPYWQASYIDASGKRVRRSTQTQSYREAQSIKAKWLLEERRNKRSRYADKTFDELMLNYLKATEKEKRAPDRDRYALKHLYPIFTGQEISRITPLEVRQYIFQRKTQGAGASTINREIGLLSSAINYANREWGWGLDNPARGCRQREPEGIVRWISRSEAASLVKAAGQEPKAEHLVDFITLALHTGMRKSELLGLEWKRVNLQDRLVYLEGRHTKSERRRSVPLNTAAYEAVRCRFRFRAEYCPDSPWVFCHRDGKQILNVKQAFSTACRKAGIENFRIHDLRHTCAAWLVTAGVPLAEVRDLLGHHSIGMTERYAHLAPENIRAAVDKLDRSEESEFASHFASHLPIRRK